MLTVRPIAPGDEAAFVALHGRCDERRASALIAASQTAFTTPEPTTRQHVFVLHDGDAASPTALLGVVALAGRTGLDWPRYSYRRGTAVHASAELKMFNAAETLMLSNDHTGSAELGVPLMASAGSVLAPQRLLIDATLLYVAAHPDRFAARLIAALPGLRSTDGSAPFWLGLGRHFHVGPVPDADPFFPTPERSHVGRLMPKHPLYSSFIGVDAQSCIGKRSLDSRAAAAALHAQGFRDRGHVDIVDAGPIVEVEVADLKSVRAGVQAVARVGSPQTRRTALVAAGDGERFRCGLVDGSLDGAAWTMRTGEAEALGVRDGERVLALAT